MITFQEYLAAKSEYYYENAGQRPWIDTQAKWYQQEDQPEDWKSPFGDEESPFVAKLYRFMYSQPERYSSPMSHHYDAMDELEEDLIREKSLDFIKNKYKIDETDLVRWMKNYPQRLLKVWNRKKANPNDEIYNFLKKYAFAGDSQIDFGHIRHYFTGRIYPPVVKGFYEKPGKIYPA